MILSIVVGESSSGLKASCMGVSVTLWSGARIGDEIRGFVCPAWFASMSDFAHVFRCWFFACWFVSGFACGHGCGLVLGRVDAPRSTACLWRRHWRMIWVSGVPALSLRAIASLSWLICCAKSL